jgi:hypothetical protein
MRPSLLLSCFPARSEAAVRTAAEKAVLAPEADLRTVPIRRLDHLQPEDAKRAPVRPESPDGLFFAKGLANTEGFRPSHWNYGKGQGGEASDACAPAEARTADGSSGAALGRLPHDAPAEEDEFSGLERAFVEIHRLALMQEPEPRTESDGSSPSEVPSAPGNPDARAAYADLRIVPLRQRGRDPARLDGLFAHKDRAAGEDASSPWLQAADAGPAGVDESTDVTAAAEPGPEASPAPVVSLEVATPTGEALPESEEGADAFDVSGLDLDAAPLAEEPERPDDAIPDAAIITAGRARKSVVTPVQASVILFGCVALLASLTVFIPPDAPPPPPPPPPPIVVVQPPPPVAAPAVPALSATLADFLARGDERLSSGDIVAARLFYEKVADAGYAQGALMMGATYDPKFLASIGVYGLRGDEQTAAAWYRRAGELGDHAAAKLGTPAHK